jgi:hypothetical protein
LFWKGCEAKKQSPNCAIGRGSARVCPIVGARSFWKQANSGLSATQLAAEATPAQSELEQLADLRDKGVLTEEEYQPKKKS